MKEQIKSLKKLNWISIAMIISLIFCLYVVCNYNVEKPTQYANNFYQKLDNNYSVFLNAENCFSENLNYPILDIKQVGNSNIIGIKCK